MNQESKDFRVGASRAHTPLEILMRTANSVACGDSLDLIRRLPDASVDAVITDPPYNIGGEFIGREKDRHDWDVFASDAAFAAFIGSYLDEFRRVLKPTGSLFVFASPAHSSLVENEVKARFRVLNHIVWRKPSHGGGRQKKEALRKFWNGSERIIFAEQGDGSRDCENAKSRANHAERASAFREIREYLHSEWVGSGLTNKDGDAATGTQMSGHYFGSSQWAFPKRAAYEALRAYAAEKGRDILNRPWDELKARYDDIRRHGVHHAHQPVLVCERQRHDSGDGAGILVALGLGHFEFRGFRVAADEGLAERNEEIKRNGIRIH